jgi:hypothetical protein
MPNVELSVYQSFFVVEEEDDRREVGRTIAGELANMGFDTSIGNISEVSDSIEVLVRYDAKWSWDITFYLLSLNIRFLDASSHAPLATATSEHSSISRKTKKGMTEEVLGNIFNGAENTAENDYFEPVLAENMVIESNTPAAKSLPIAVQSIGYGAQFASDEEFSNALRTSLANHSLFDSLSDDGEYVLTVALNSLETDETHLVVFGTVFFRNVIATATWALANKEHSEILYVSEITTKCPEAELKDAKNVTSMTACAIRENIRSGIARLSDVSL